MSLNYKCEQTHWGLDVTLKGRVCIDDLEYWFRKVFKNLDHLKLNKLSSTKNLDTWEILEQIGTNGVNSDPMNDDVDS